MSAPLSIIIPTLNAADRIGPCLGALGPGVSDGLIREVIFTDGGSDDGIAEIADALGARLVTGPAGRGGQLARGAETATGTWLLFLHADTLLPSDWPSTLSHHFEQAPGKAGYFGLRFDSPAPMARVTAGWANLRSALCALPYGDQALLISRQLYAASGGYPDFPLMEDVAMARRIGRRRLTRLPGQVITSAARYERDGWFRRGWINLTTLALFLMGRPADRLVARYRRR